jgi:hypothetical protein
MRYSKALLAVSLLCTTSFAHISKSGEAVAIGPGTYPRATKLSDGTLFGAYTDTAGDNTTIISTHSRDNGASWEPLGQVDTGPKATRDVDNPFIHELPNGNILCAFRNHDRAGSGYSFYRITVCVSEDKGATWKYLSTPASDPAGPTGNWEPFIQQALDGTLQLYYSRENSGTDQDSLLRRSADGGKTWSSAQVISGTGIETRDGMLGVARTPKEDSPSKVAIFETGNPALGHPFSVWTVRTEDDGKTWSSERTPVYQPTGHNAGAPQIIRVGAKLIASFGTNEEGGDWPAGAIKVMASSDGGKTWDNKTTVVEQPAFWAGLLALDDSSFLVLYERGGTSYAQRMEI